MRNFKIFILIIIGIILLVSPGFTQIVFDQPSSGGGRMIYSHWSIEDKDGTKKLNQFVIPVYGFVPIKDNLEARFSLSTVSSNLDSAGTDYKLSGLSDLRVQFNQSLADDRLLLSVGLNLPTGKKKLNLTDEWPIMEYLSRDYINVPVRKYGEGLGINLLTGYATQAGEMQLGATMSIGIEGAYKAYETSEGSDDYNPGDIFSLSVGADGPFKNWKVSSRISFTTYGTDKMDKKKIYRAGRQLALQFGAATDKGTYQIATNINYILRGRNTRYDSSEEINDQLQLYGNEFAWNSTVSFALADNYNIIPSLELRFVGANEEDLGKSHLFGLGSDLRRRFSDDIGANFGFKYYTGSADGGDIDLKGFQISLGLAAAFR